MNTYEFIEAYILTGQKIDVLWNFFVTVHLAIAGFLLYAKPNYIHRLSIVFLVVGYCAFSAINYRAKTIEYEFLNSLVLEITTRDTTSVSVNEYFTGLGFDDRFNINMLVHVFSFALIIIVFLLSERNK